MSEIIPEKLENRRKISPLFVVWRPKSVLVLGPDFLLQCSNHCKKNDTFVPSGQKRQSIARFSAEQNYIIQLLFHILIDVVHRSRNIIKQIL